MEENCSHLGASDQEKLLKLLTEFKDLFDGTLGDWNTEPVSLKLKKDAKPCNGRCFPTPKVHEDTLKNEIGRFCEVWGTEVAARVRVSFSFIHSIKTAPNCAISQ